LIIGETRNNASCDADEDPLDTRPDGLGCDEFSDYESDDEEEDD